MPSVDPVSNTGVVAAVVVVEYGGETDILCCNNIIKRYHCTVIMYSGGEKQLSIEGNS